MTAKYRTNTIGKINEYNKCLRRYHFKRMICMICFWGAIFFILAKAIKTGDEKVKADTRTDWEVVDDKYTFYIDGNEVDPGNVSEDLYDIRYDKDHKKVFMTRKSGKDTTIIPFFLP